MPKCRAGKHILFLLMPTNGLNKFVNNECEGTLANNIYMGKIYKKTKCKKK